MYMHMNYARAELKSETQMEEMLQSVRWNVSPRNLRISRTVNTTSCSRSDFFSLWFFWVADLRFMPWIVPVSIIHSP
jgi:hypothetical protein